MYKQKKIWLMILLFILCCLAIPLFIDHVIIGNNFPSHIPNSEWVAFLGGYIGSLIGAIASLAGILITIRYTIKQSRYDRELQIRPYCVIRYIPNDKNICTTKFIGHILYEGTPFKDCEPDSRSLICVKNVGLGPAIELNVTVNEIDDEREHYSLFIQNTTDEYNNTVTVLQPGEDAFIPVVLYLNFDPITDNDIYVIEDSPIGKYFAKEDVHKKYKSFDIGINLNYADMFNNIYSQEIILSVLMHITGSAEGKMKHSFNLRLKETTLPRKVKG